MKTSEDYYFEISISEKSYSTKPSSEDYKSMKFRKVVVNPSMFMEYVNEQPMNTMRKDNFIEKVGEKNFRPHIDDAIDWAKELIK